MNLRVPVVSLVAILSALAAAVPAAAELRIALAANRSSPQPVGSVLTVFAVPTGLETIGATYQFSYRIVGLPGGWRLLRDFDEGRSVEWATLDEGLYEFRVLGRPADHATQVEDVLRFAISPLAGVIGNAPVVVPTRHPLVALYSAPSCPFGLVRVRFAPLGTAAWQATPFKRCISGKTQSFYVAGMLSNTTYLLQQEIYAGARVERGPLRTFRTRTPEIPYEQPIVDLFTPQTSTADGLVVTNYVIGTTDRALAAVYDLRGRLVWYYRDLIGVVQLGSIVTRPVEGGTMLVIMDGERGGELLREVDVAGLTVRETSIARVAEQVVALGHEAPGSFHHEATRLPSGHTLVIASVERIVEYDGQATNVVADLIVDLDRNFQVAWVWNGFDHLDVNRRAILREDCQSEGPGCPPLFLGPVANDWMHSNAIDYVPEDGNLLLSMRHQDWVIKIDYRNGAGSGAVLWRLGEGGDFALTDASGDPWPWFSHQHDARQIGNRVLVYDNGNTRVGQLGPGHSRGQVFAIDELARTAELVHNFDLGNYAFALGTAQPLTNGNFAFVNGVVVGSEGQFNEVVEVTPDGTFAWKLRSAGGMYRAHRVRDMYRPQ